MNTELERRTSYEWPLVWRRDMTQAVLDEQARCEREAAYVAERRDLQEAERYDETEARYKSWAALAAEIAKDDMSTQVEIASARYELARLEWVALAKERDATIAKLQSELARLHGGVEEDMRQMAEQDKTIAKLQARVRALKPKLAKPVKQA